MREINEYESHDIWACPHAPVPISYMCHMSDHMLLILISYFWLESDLEPTGTHVSYKLTSKCWQCAAPNSVCVVCRAADSTAVLTGWRIQSVSRSMSESPTGTLHSKSKHASKNNLTGSETTQQEQKHVPGNGFPNQKNYPARNKNAALCCRRVFNASGLFWYLHQIVTRTTRRSSTIEILVE